MDFVQGLHSRFKDKQKSNRSLRFVNADDIPVAYFGRNERLFQPESERLFRICANADFGISRTVKSTFDIIC